MPISLRPVPTIEESRRRLPLQAQQLLDRAVGPPWAWFAAIHTDAFQGHAPSFEYFALGSAGFGHLEGQLLQNRRWRVTFTWLAADLTAARHHNEVTLGPPPNTRPAAMATSFPEPQDFGPPGLSGEFRGYLGNLPVATQVFLQDPFQHDVVVGGAFRLQRAWEGQLLKDQTWCWIEGRAFLGFAYAHRSIHIPVRPPGVSDDIESLWLAQRPWTVAASSAVLATELCSRTVHEIVG